MRLQKPRLELLRSHGVDTSPQGLRAYLLTRAAPDVDAQAIATLIAQLGADQYAARSAAAEKLQDVGEPARAALADARANSQDWEIRCRANRILESFDPISDLPLYAAIRVACAIGIDEPVDTLVSIAPACHSELTRLALQRSLAAVADTSDLEQLDEAMKSPRASVRAVAAYARAMVVDRNRLAACYASLKDPSRWVRLATAQGLARRYDRRAIAAFADLVAGPNDDAGRIALAELRGFAQWPLERADIERWLAEEAPDIKFFVYAPGYTDISAMSARIEAARGERGQRRFRPLIQLVAPDLPELPIGTVGGQTPRSYLLMDADGARWNAFRFRMPDDRPRHLFWDFTMAVGGGARWWIEPATGTMGSRSRDSSGSMWDETVHWHCTERLQREALGCGRTYVMWFAFEKQLLPRRAEVGLQAIPNTTIISASTASLKPKPERHLNTQLAQLAKHFETAWRRGQIDECRGIYEKAVRMLATCHPADTRWHLPLRIRAHLACVDGDLDAALRDARRSLTMLTVGKGGRFSETQRKSVLAQAQVHLYRHEFDAAARLVKTPHAAWVRTQDLDARVYWQFLWEAAGICADARDYDAALDLYDTVLQKQTGAKRQWRDYVALHRWATGVRAGTAEQAKATLLAFDDGRRDERRRPAEKWTATLIAAALGDVDAEHVVAEAGERDKWVCEAHYYLALHDLAQGDMDGCRRHAEAAVAATQRRSIERRGAVLLLHRLATDAKQ
ncbi:MAG: hypothetical protein GVY16_03460 [Planctomycetes bacterium]|jgi:hypothetical protein|nr:hypothetical protein [Planctomycetota bacterium]